MWMCNSENGNRFWLFPLCVVLAGCAAFSQTNAFGEPESAKRIVAIEWIPLHAHTEVLKSLESELGRSNVASSKIEIKRIVVFGDDDELAKTIHQLNADPPDVIVGFGDHISQSIRRECRNVPRVAVLARDLAALAGDDSAPSDSAPFVAIDAEPDARTVWRVARELRPAAECLGFIYTDRYAPNSALADRLEEEGRRTGYQLARIRVDPGFCRTESDFRKVLNKAAETHKLDVLYVPDDPNCSRFGPTIYDSATKLGIPAIGSEATIGRGCAAAIQIDQALLGTRTASACASLLQEKRAVAELLSVPGRVVIDPSAFRGQGLVVSDWLRAHAEALP